jgi:hypothetical protein
MEEEEEKRTTRREKREKQEQLRGTMDDPANLGAAAAAAEAAMHTQREPLQAIKHQSKSLPEWETNGWWWCGWRRKIQLSLL